MINIATNVIGLVLRHSIIVEIFYHSNYKPNNQH